MSPDHYTPANYVNPRCPVCPAATGILERVALIEARRQWERRKEIESRKQFLPLFRKVNP